MIQESTRRCCSIPPSTNVEHSHFVRQSFADRRAIVLVIQSLVFPVSLWRLAQIHSNAAQATARDGAIRAAGARIARMHLCGSSPHTHTLGDTLRAKTVIIQKSTMLFSILGRDSPSLRMRHNEVGFHRFWRAARSLCIQSLLNVFPRAVIRCW